jgi:hypothetical protein
LTWLDRAQATKLGALIFSWDFGLALVVGFSGGLLFAFSPGVRAQTFTFFLTLGGISAGVAALTLAPMAMMLSSLSVGFQQLLARVRDGLPGLLLPYRRVATVAAAACLVSIGVSVVALAETSLLPWPIYAFATGIPIGLFTWSVAGCVQVIGHSIKTVEQDRQFRALQERRDQATRKAG